MYDECVSVHAKNFVVKIIMEFCKTKRNKDRYSAVIDYPIILYVLLIFYKK